MGNALLLQHLPQGTGNVFILAGEELLILLQNDYFTPEPVVKLPQFKGNVPAPKDQQVTG